MEVGATCQLRYIFDSTRRCPPRRVPVPHSQLIWTDIIGTRTANFSTNWMYASQKSFNLTRENCLYIILIFPFTDVFTHAQVWNAVTRLEYYYICIVFDFRVSVYIESLLPLFLLPFRASFLLRGPRSITACTIKWKKKKEKRNTTKTR